MSIKKLEELKEKLAFEDVFHQHKGDLFVINILDNLISILKHQSDQLQHLHRELANKEDKIDVNNIKEVKRING